MDTSQELVVMAALQLPHLRSYVRTYVHRDAGLQCLGPTGLTSQHREGPQLPTWSVPVQILLHDAQANVLQHTIEELFVTIFNDIYLRGYVGLLRRNKVREVATHARGDSVI